MNRSVILVDFLRFNLQHWAGDIFFLGRGLSPLSESHQIEKGYIDFMSNSNSDINNNFLEPVDFISLYDRFVAANDKKQMQLIPDLIAQGEIGLDVLMKFLHQAGNTPKIIHGNVYQAPLTLEISEVQNFLRTNFPTGILPLQSAQGIDYTKLQQLLAKQDFLESDRLTMQKLCELAGDATVKRKWLYFTEVDSLPVIDLQTINNLWLLHSEGKFGFSVQRELWLAFNQDFIKLWSAIGWKSGNDWTRYPQQFTWNLNAPKGHLPLSNQLRGVQVIKAILSHPAWN